MEQVHAAGLTVFLSQEILPAATHWRSRLPVGIWAGVLNSGRLRITREDGTTEHWDPGTHGAFCITESEEIEHVTKVDGACSAVFVHIGFDDMADLTDDEDTASLMLHGPSAPANAGLSRGRSALIAALARRMETTAHTGLGRRFFLASKAMEMLAVMSAEPAPPPRTDMSPREVRAVREARDRAMARLDDPPSVPELARAVGLSVRGLSDGFRRLYGQPLYAFIKEERLLLAKRLLQDGDLTVNQVAHAIGYGPAHLSTAIRARFGQTPRDLRAH
ncbi:MAG: AraC family transcriptional regulator [Pseudomonadota bacterium]